jgi:acetate kinase
MKEKTPMNILGNKNEGKPPIPIEISAHHLHLSNEHVEALFGKGHALTIHSLLSQPGQYACKEKVTLVGCKGRIERVPVLGPVRKETQIEITMTDQFKLGVHPPIRESGDLNDTPGITLVGPAGAIVLKKGVICPMRHIHMTPFDALIYGVQDKSIVHFHIEDVRELVLRDVIVRVDPNFKLVMHIDNEVADAMGFGEETGVLA